jgi:hypothetical protein
MLSKILTPESIRFLHEISGASIRSAKGMLIAGLTFGLTLGGGFAFLSIVIDSHVYHEWIDTTFFSRPHMSATSDQDVTYSNVQVALKATDVRKIGHIVDTFERSFIAALDARIQEILEMNFSNERQRALADFVSHLNTNRTDTLHVIHQLEALRNSKPEGVPVEFADIDASIDRLKQGTDMLAVAAAELQTGTDQVTLHVVQKQLQDALSALALKAHATTVAAVRH